MYWKRKDNKSRARLESALDTISYSSLNKLAKQLNVKPKSRKKVDSMAVILPLFENRETAEKLYKSLNHLQQKAIAEAVYHEDFEYNDGRFAAKYGSTPSFGTKGDYYEIIPNILRLFIYSDAFGKFIPKDLAERIKPFVKKPKGFQINVTEELPEKINVEFPSWQKQAPQKVPLTKRETENETLQNFWTVLRLVEDKKISVSDKTHKPSKASINNIVSVLMNGDFYELKEDKDYYQQIDAIQGFSWAMILQASKITQVSAKKLKVSNAGRKILSKPIHEIIKQLWKDWEKTTLLDEFNRVDEIKGQKRKGRTNLTGIKPRRNSVIKALEFCPVGEWISIEEFFRCVRLNFDFEITRDEWNLYIEDSNYGSLGYEYGKDLDKWLVLQGRYILAVLFEYFATLGLIDVAFIEPFDARQDFRELWGTDDLFFLSRYDGLKFIRLNNLGAFCLGFTDEYSPPEIEIKSSFTILPNLQIKIADGDLTVEENLFLESFAKKESDKIWHLSLEQTIKSLEKGQTISNLRDFLESREEQLLPETVEGFMKNAETRSKALTEKGSAKIIECETNKIADEIAKHRLTKKLCQRVGKKSLAILNQHEKKFRTNVRKIGYGTKYN